ncbi:MAG: glutamate--tRNA ligase family protein [Candidatus Shikimatogenerans bostrichidophilus]|nr:MAG: glutamate--tRNA ligase family protein [Candidatus Shikimatogenerans bostrichidophilus]
MNNFIIKEIYKDINNGLSKKKLKFRFAPEPNGVLHLGHVKAIYINFKLAKIFKCKINLRFDDTNPKNENLFYVRNIIDNIKWLGFKWDKLSFTSDYFLILYKWAKKLIIYNKAYIQYYNPKKNKYYNVYDIDKNLYYFNNMKLGKYDENLFVLRANISKELPNYHLKNPIIYRVIKKNHYKTLNNWCIYPTYDWAHGQSDYIEKISHSLCSIEFQNHKPLYNLFINYIYNKNFNSLKPKQIEFSKLNIIDTITSKRQFNYLIKKKIIKNYEDPRLSTINSFKKKGYKSISIINFIKKRGFTKRNYNISIKTLDIEVKKHFIKTAPILMVIFNPIKLIITNFKKQYVKWIKLNNKNKIPFTRYIYIEYDDFKLKHDHTFYRLSFKNYIRLKYSYIIKAYKIKKKKNIIKKIYCKIYKNIKSKKIKSTIQWVSSNFIKKIKILNYKYIFFKKNKIYNINSIKSIIGYTDNISIKNLKINKIYQFLRIGFFSFSKKNNFIKILYMKKKY